MINPILERELKARMRTWKSPIAILVFLVAIGMFAYLGYMTAFDNSYRSGIDPEVMAAYFNMIAIVKLIIIMCVVPVLTATSISSEREKQTLDLMLCADVSPWSIIFGKIFAALAFVVLLVVLAIPFFGMIFILGGVTIVDILKIEAYYLASAFMLSTIGIYFSSRFKRNVTSIIMTYVFLAFLYFTPFFIMIITTISLEISGFEDIYNLVCLLFGPNPGFGLLSLLTSNMNIMTGIQSMNTGSPLAYVPTWVISCVFFTLISSIMLILTKRNLNKK